MFIQLYVYIITGMKIEVVISRAIPVCAMNTCDND